MVLGLDMGMDSLRVALVLVDQVQLEAVSTFIEKYIFCHSRA